MRIYNENLFFHKFVVHKFVEFLYFSGVSGIAFLRVGYHYSTQDKGLPSFASAGLGLKFAGVELNAAYLFASEALGNTMTFGLGYSF